jgi:hypothetical protein
MPINAANGGAITAHLGLEVRPLRGHNRRVFECTEAAMDTLNELASDLTRVLDRLQREAADHSQPHGAARLA